jgi:AraC-like DNA-binding protein
MAEFLRHLPYVLGSLDEEAIIELAASLVEEASSEFGLEPRLDPAALGEEVKRLVEEARRQAPGTRAVLAGIGGLLSVERPRREPKAIELGPAARARHPGVRRAIALIAKAYPERLSTEDLARTACLSKSQFMALFKKETGFTPHEYLRRVRIENAVRLLEEGQEVLDTCCVVGFSSLSGFEQAFVELAGIKPSEIKLGSRA